MSKPEIHAQNSADKFGGLSVDYLEIHQFMDSSKAVMADKRHRALTHNSWFISQVLPRVFGETISNAEGKEVSVRDIGEQHVLEDFAGVFIPSAQDWLQEIELRTWMMNGERLPPSMYKLINNYRFSGLEGDGSKQQAAKDAIPKPVLDYWNGLPPFSD